MASSISEHDTNLIDDLPHRTGERQRVVVIGAGPAGLTAAYQLMQAGHSVLVLEARLRPGGRIHTIRAPFADGMYAEAGALFIPVDHPFLMKYIDVAGLRNELQSVRPEQLNGFFYLQGHHYLETPNGPVLWDIDGRLEPTRWPGHLLEAEQTKSMEELGAMYFNRIEGGWGGDPFDLRWLPEHLRAFDEQGLPEFLRRSLGASDAAAELIRATHFAEKGDNGRTISPVFALQQWGDTRQIGSATTWTTIPGGNDRWVNSLAFKLGANIEYGAEVVSIDHDTSGATLAVRQGGLTASVTADHVICALPFSCLRKITISPTLSASKRRVVSELESTDVGHLFIQCRRRVWRRADGQGLGAFSATDSDLACILRDATFNQDCARAILDLYLVGPQLKQMAAYDTDDQRLSFALIELEKMFPGISKEVEGAVFYSWTHEPFSRGDYISYSAGQFFDLWPHVSLPEGRLHFAGDQTSGKSGWQEGAIESAHRAAHEVFRAAEVQAT